MDIEKLAFGAAIYSRLKANYIDNSDDLQNAFQNGEIRRILKNDAIKTVRNVCRNAKIILPEIGEPLNLPAQAAPAEIITEQDDDHAKALALHRKILDAAQIVTYSLYDMCSAIKEMRDGKHYKALSYDNFDAYCDSELGISRAQAYRYIQIASGMTAENVSSMRQIGTTKLALLASVTEEQREEIAVTVDVESATVRELKAQIDALKHQSDNLEKLRADAEERAQKWYEKADSADADIGQLRNRVSELETKYVKADNQNLVLKETIASKDKILRGKDISMENLRSNIEQLQAHITELESRPVEIAVQEDTEALELMRKEYESKIADLKEEMENAKDVEGEFKALLRIAKDALHHITIYMARGNWNTILMYKAEQLLKEAQKEFDAVKEDKKDAE